MLYCIGKYNRPLLLYRRVGKTTLSDFDEINQQLRSVVVQLPNPRGPFRHLLDLPWTCSSVNVDRIAYRCRDDDGDGGDDDNDDGGGISEWHPSTANRS